MFDFFIIDIAFFQLVLEVAPLFPEYRKWIDELSKDRLSRWEYMILKAKQQGEIKGSLDTSVPDVGVDQYVEYRVGYR